MTGNKRRAEFELETMPHLNDIYRTAVRLTMSRIDAEDLVQETFLQAWKSFDGYELGTNCRAWLYKIFFHKYKHYQRKTYTRARFTQEKDEYFLENVSYVPPVPEHLTDEEIITALNKLPEHYREVSLLADVHDLSYKEVAEILDIPIGTVMSRLYRARQLLRDFLSNIAGDYGISPTLKFAGSSLFLRIAPVLLFMFD